MRYATCSSCAALSAIRICCQHRPSPRGRHDTTCRPPLGTLTRSVSEGIKRLPRLRSAAITGRGQYFLAATVLNGRRPPRQTALRTITCVRFCPAIAHIAHAEPQKYRHNVNSLHRFNLRMTIFLVRKKRRRTSLCNNDLGVTIFFQPSRVFDVNQAFSAGSLESNK